MKLAGLSHVPQWQWVIGSSAYQEDFLDGLKAIRSMTVVVTIIAILLAGLLAYLFAEFITRPIKILEKSSALLAKGDLTVKVDEKLTQNKDEIGNLANSFSVMVNNLPKRNKVNDIGFIRKI